MHLPDEPLRAYLGDYGSMPLDEGIRETYETFRSLIARACSPRPNRYDGDLQRRNHAPDRKHHNRLVRGCHASEGIPLGDVHPLDYPTVLAVGYMASSSPSAAAAGTASRCTATAWLGSEKDTIEQVPG